MSLWCCAARAAEWSVTPVYSSAFDYDSNRGLSDTARGTSSALLTADLRFKWALEDTDVLMEPRYTLRRYSDAALGNGDDRSFSAALDRVNERSSLQLSGTYTDQSTLISELLETGIVSSDTHRRQLQAGSNWNWSQTERWQLVSQMSYLDVSYYGTLRSSLPGYRYPSGSLGERWSFSEKSSVTISAYGSELSSDVPGGSSHEYGLQAQLIHYFTERIHLDGSLGKSTRLLSGISSRGTDAAVALTYDLTRGNAALNYTRSLVPYGVGFLVERQQLTGSALRRLTEYLDVNLSLLHIKNSDTAVLLGLDRKSIDSISTGLTWHPAETWNVSVQLSGIRTQPPISRFSDSQSKKDVNEWRSTVSLTWNPRPTSRSW